MMRVIGFVAVASLVTLGALPSAQDRLAHMLVQPEEGSRAGRRLQETLTTSSGNQISLLHWNPHWECFLNNKYICAQNAIQLATNMIRSLGYDPDFAGFIEFEDPLYTPSYPYKLLGGDVCTMGYGDWATIMYDSSKWAPVGNASSGCLPTGSSDARAYIVQRFNSLHGLGEVNVASVHFPHPSSGSPFYAASTDLLGGLLRQGNGKFILMADTNLYSHQTNQALYNQLGFSGTPPVSSELFGSCCAHANFPGTFTFDRILSNMNGRDMVTTMPLGRDAPQWAKDTGSHDSSFHLPVVLKFNLA